MLENFSTAPQKADPESLSFAKEDILIPSNISPVNMKFTENPEKSAEVFAKLVKGSTRKVFTSEEGFLGYEAYVAGPHEFIVNQILSCFIHVQPVYWDADKNISISYDKEDLPTQDNKFLSLVEQYITTVLVGDFDKGLGFFKENKFNINSIRGRQFDFEEASTNIPANDNLISKQTQYFADSILDELCPNYYFADLSSNEKSLLQDTYSSLVVYAQKDLEYIQTTIHLDSFKKFIVAVLKKVNNPSVHETADVIIDTLTKNITLSMTKLKEIMLLPE